MSEEEAIGYIKAWASKWDAGCTAHRCVWTIRKSTRAEAADSLRLHAAICHPLPIAVFR